MTDFKQIIEGLAFMLLFAMIIMFGAHIGAWIHGLAQPEVEAGFKSLSIDQKLVWLVNH